MLSFLKRLAIPAIALSFTGVVSTASAEFILAGQTATIPTGDPFVNVQGTILASYSGTYDNGLGATGKYQEIVVQDAVTHDMDFLVQASADSGISDLIDHVSIGFTFAPFTTDVGSTLTVNGTPGLSSFGTPGTTVTTSIDRNSTGNAIDFNFGTGITAGTTTEVMVVKTDAPTFRGGTITFDDNASVTYTTTFGPTAVPLPATASTGLALLGGLGLLSGVSVLRRRRQMA